MSGNGVPRSAGAVVIGGGVNGLSTAFQLAKRGLGDVVVVERKHVAAGATGKSGALVRCHYANVPEARLTNESIKIFRNWDDEVGHGSSGFDPVGFVQVVAPGEEANLRANVADQQAIGVETSLVSAAELREIEPLLNTDDLAYAAWEPNSGYADPNATAYAYAAAATAHGATILTDTPALQVLTEGDRVSGVETANGTISTRVVVIAAGSWADRLLLPLDLDWGLVPVRPQVAIFRWPAEIEGRKRHPVVIDAINHSWLRPEGFSSTLIGAERDVVGVNPDTFDETLDERVVDLSRKALAARFPVFANATMRGGWAGTFMRSQDGHPIIDQVPSIPGLWVMAGDSGTSFKTAPAIGICLAQWILDGRSELVDMTPFRSTRFAEGAPWLDAHSYGDDRTLTVSR